MARRCAYHHASGHADGGLHNATVLANYFAISELTMGLTAIAIGTSLPELATAIAGVRKGENVSLLSEISLAQTFLILSSCWVYPR